MRASLRALLSEVFDYAGLFPPAGLDLDTAIRNYARFLGEPESWMLGRFICPASRLGEIQPVLRDVFPGESKPELSVLLRTSDSADGFVEALRGELNAVSAFRQDAGDRAGLRVFELRLPLDLCGHDDAARLSELVDQSDSSIQQSGVEAHVPGFYELRLTADWRRAAVSQVQGIQQCLRGRSETRANTLGLKLRCGGLDASAFPTCEQIAFVIEQCRDHRVPLKFTAGLHHPIRHYDAGVQTHMHGFINVFAAGVLASALPLEFNDILAIVEEEDPRQFSFTDDFLAWNEAEATLREIEYARKNAVISVGSCSFDEPREDLRRLDLL